CWRALQEIASGGGRPLGRGTAAGNAAPRPAGAGAVAPPRPPPGGAGAGKGAGGVTGHPPGGPAVAPHPAEGHAAPDFGGCGHPPRRPSCDNTAEPLAGKLRKGSAGSNTVADHLEVLGAAVAALPPAYRRRLMVTCDGAGASHGLIERLDALAARPGHQL